MQTCDPIAIELQTTMCTAYYTRLRIILSKLLYSTPINDTVDTFS